jgi:lipoprotein-releasing system permease protein
VIIRIALLAVALSIAIMIISDAIVIGFQSEIKNKITGFASHIEISKTRTSFSFEMEPMRYDSSLTRSVSSLAGVQHIQQFATKPGIIKTSSAIEGVVLKGVGKDFDWNAFSDKLIEGKTISMTDSEPSKDIILSKALANKLELKVGDDVIMYFVQEPIRARKFKISGIYQTSIEEIDKIFVLCDIRQIQQLNGWTNKEIGGYEVFVQDGFDSRGTFAPHADISWKPIFRKPFAFGNEGHFDVGLGYDRIYKLDEVNDQVRYLLDINQDTRTIKERFPQIFDWLSLLNKNIEIILTLMAFVAAINMITALIIMILERTSMIGILKALGASDWTVRRIFLYNSMVLIGLGLLFGNFLAISLLLVQEKFHVIKLAEQSYYVPVVPVYFSWPHIIYINIGAFIFCTFAMLFPSILVSRTKPVKAIRFE